MPAVLPRSSSTSELDVGGWKRSESRCIPNVVAISSMRDVVSCSFVRSSGLVKTALGASVWAVAPARCASVLGRMSVLSVGVRFLVHLRIRHWRVSFFLSFLSSWWLYFVYLLIHLVLSRTTGLASSFQRRRSSLPDLPYLFWGLASSRVPGYFLGCACCSYGPFPGICGVEACGHSPFLPLFALIFSFRVPF